METWRSCDLDESKCICQGEGWIDVSPNFEECPIHFVGQLHPDTKALLLDDAKALKEEERKSKAKWQIKQNLDSISYCEKKILLLKGINERLERDMLHKATTIKFKAVRIKDETTA